ncbi:MAG: AAA family ATPase [Bacteroidales bacterium]
MEENINPFPVSGYYGLSLFCDREDETKALIRNIENGINTTLISIRRMGKTGTILHLFDVLKSNKDIKLLYVDLYASQNLKDFTEQIALTILKTFPENKSTGKRFLKLLKSFSPVISFDPLTGHPEIHFEFSQNNQYEHSLAGLFNFLENQEENIVFAMDEFQQIANYPEANTEALLRSLFQNIKNIRFIFSGSSKHLMNELFNNSKRPFFASTQLISLTNIPKEKYLAFIKEKMEVKKRFISNEALEFIADWSRLHTYYTQALCNRIFAEKIKNIEVNTVKQACNNILKEQEATFFQFRNFLTPIQWQFLKAIAREEKVFQPNSANFIQKYKLGSQANAQRAIKSLIDKELIYQMQIEDKNYYSVYDCFFSRWLERI